MTYAEIYRPTEQIAVGAATSAQLVMFVVQGDARSLVVPD